MKKRKRRPETLYQIALKKMRKVANRHVLVLEAAMTETQKRRTFKLAGKLRICGNRLTGEMRKRLDQLLRTKAYRQELKEYGRLRTKLSGLDSRDERYRAARKDLDASASRLADMQKDKNVTWDHARKFMEVLAARYNIPAVFALARAEDVWQGVEKVLYGNGERLHFRKKGDLPIIRAKQEGRGVVACMKNGELSFSINPTKKDEKRPSADSRPRASSGFWSPIRMISSPDRSLR